jgi:hypothetical protein
VFGSAGVYNLTVEYAGNETYNSSTNSKNITVVKQDTSIGLDKVPKDFIVGNLLTGINLS